MAPEDIPMLELFAVVSLLAIICLALCIYIAMQLRDERDEALQDLTIAYGDIKALTNRVSVLRGDNIAQQTTIDTLREGHDRLVDERDEAVRELGRVKAEKVAEKLSAPVKHPEGTIAFTPKRGPNGRFIAKPKAPKPIKPIACA
jgi:hypothetical protein